MSASDIGEIFEQGRKGGGDSVPDVNKANNFLKYITHEGKAKSKCKVGLILFFYRDGLRENLIPYSYVSAQTSGTLLLNLEESFKAPKSVFQDMNKWVNSRAYFKGLTQGLLSQTASRCMYL